jgi:hypothetical protein
MKASPIPDADMSRAIHLNRLTVLLLAGTTAVGAVWAGDKKATEAPRKAGEAQVSPAVDSQRSETRSAKGDRATAKTAVGNPYEVPLIKNAGSLPAPR